MIILIILILRTTGLRSVKRAVILRMFLLKLVLNILQGAPAVEQSLRRHCFLQCKRQYCRSCFPEKLALRKGYRVLVSEISLIVVYCYCWLFIVDAVYCSLGRGRNKIQPTLWERGDTIVFFKYIILTFRDDGYPKIPQACLHDGMQHKKHDIIQK